MSVYFLFLACSKAIPAPEDLVLAFTSVILTFEFQGHYTILITILLLRSGSMDLMIEGIKSQFD